MVEPWRRNAFPGLRGLARWADEAVVGRSRPRLSGLQRACGPVLLVLGLGHDRPWLDRCRRLDASPNTAPQPWTGCIAGCPTTDSRISRLDSRGLQRQD